MSRSLALRGPQGGCPHDLAVDPDLRVPVTGELLESFTRLAVLPWSSHSSRKLANLVGLSEKESGFLELEGGNGCGVGDRVGDLSNGDGADVIQPELAKYDVMDVGTGLLIYKMVSIMKAEMDRALWPDLQGVTLEPILNLMCCVIGPSIASHMDGRGGRMMGDLLSNKRELGRNDKVIALAKERVEGL